MIWLGIDPGLEGALATIDGDDVRVVATPIIRSRVDRDEYDLAEMLFALDHAVGQDAYVVLERLHPLHGAKGGAIANYQRGRATALWQMALVAAQIPHALVLPQVWQRVMLREVSGENTKEKSIRAASRFFPDVDLRRTARSRVASDGFSDALLLAEYGRRTRGAVLEALR